MSEQRKKKGLTRPIEVVRAELMADAQTKEIAETLGVSLEDYVAQVLDYAQHPDKEPMLYVANEAELRAMGEEAHTVEEVSDWMAKVASGEINLGAMEFKDGFEGGNAKGVPLGSPAGASPTPTHPGEAGNALRNQVAKQLKRGDNFKG